MTMPVSAAQEAQIIQKINDCLAKIESKADELVANVNGFLSNWAVPGFIKDKVRAATTWLIEQLRRAFDAVAEIVTHMGSPATLWATADAWSRQVGGPVSNVSGDADPAQSQALQDWTGQAATAYSTTLGPQRKAIDAVKSTFADPISSQLSAVARAIWVFWGAVVVALAALVACMIGAVASSATILGLPAAPFIAGAGALAFCAALLVGGENLRSQCSDSNTTLTQKLADDSALRGGVWPPAVAAAQLSDGSMSDGNDSGWHVR